MHTHACVCQNEKEKEVHGAAGGDRLLLSVNPYSFTNELRGQPETAYKESGKESVVPQLPIYFLLKSYRCIVLALPALVIHRSSDEHKPNLFSPQGIKEEVISRPGSSRSKWVNFVMPAPGMAKLNFSCKDPRMFLN